jgi:hypothetical protein
MLGLDSFRKYARVPSDSCDEGYGGGFPITRGNSCFLAMTVAGPAEEWAQQQVACAAVADTAAQSKSESKYPATARGVEWTGVKNRAQVLKRWSRVTHWEVGVVWKRDGEPRGRQSRAQKCKVWMKENQNRNSDCPSSVQRRLSDTLGTRSGSTSNVLMFTYSYGALQLLFHCADSKLFVQPWLTAVRPFRNYRHSRFLMRMSLPRNAMIIISLWRFHSPTFAPPRSGDRILISSCRITDRGCIKDALDRNTCCECSRGYKILETTDYVGLSERQRLAIHSNNRRRRIERG